jgi:hypothetical protein
MLETRAADSMYTRTRTRVLTHTHTHTHKLDECSPQNSKWEEKSSSSSCRERRSGEPDVNQQSCTLYYTYTYTYTALLCYDSTSNVTAVPIIGTESIIYIYMIHCSLSLSLHFFTYFFWIVDALSIGVVQQDTHAAVHAEQFWKQLWARREGKHMALAARGVVVWVCR